MQSDLARKLLIEITDRQAATKYEISAVTAMQGLYTKLDILWPSPTEGFDAPTEEQRTILVYARSTGASLHSIQLAKLAGYRVIMIFNPRNLELVTS